MRRTVRYLVLLLLGAAPVVTSSAISVWSCAKKSVDDQRGETIMPERTIEAVLKDHTDEWMATPGVVGTAIGECEGEPCIKIYVVEKTAELAAQIASTVEGYPVVIEESGEFRALHPG